MPASYYILKNYLGHGITPIEQLPNLVLDDKLTQGNKDGDWNDSREEGNIIFKKKSLKFPNLY